MDNTGQTTKIEACRRAYDIIYYYEKSANHLITLTTVQTMGNRAVLTTEENFNNNGIGIYLHWNGGRDSVEGFLAYAKLKKLRGGDYGFACLAGIITNYMGNGLSCGVDTVDRLDCDNWDNGVYLVDLNKWEIVGRKFNHGVEQLEYNLLNMLYEIDQRQPEHMRLTKSQWAEARILPSSCGAADDYMTAKTAAWIANAKD